MKIDDDHLFHGAALIQIAENEQFTAINSMVVEKIVNRSAYKINDKIGIYLKYASKFHGNYEEYIFTFTRIHLKELDNIVKISPKLFIVLVCVKAKQICVLSYNKLKGLIDRRIKEKGDKESQYTILVNLPKGKSFRVYLSSPGERKDFSGDQIIVNRNDFPSKIFQ